MIIQLPEWEGWRIAGSGLDWQIQKLCNRKDREDTWEGTNYFPSLEAAIGYACERTLRESPKTIAAIREVHDECEKTKSRLLKAVKKAVG